MLLLFLLLLLLFFQLLTRDDSQLTCGKISTDKFEQLISLYACRSRVEPGDAVGVIAAQVIDGEHLSPIVIT